MGFYLVAAISKKTLELRNKRGKLKTVTVHPPWLQFLKYLKQLDQVFIESNSNELDETSKLIIEPHLLVAVTRSIDAITCPRIPYVKNFGAESIKNKHTISRITEGNLLHEVFTQRVIFGKQVESTIDEIISLSKLEILTADLSENYIRKYLQENATKLNGITIRGNSEIECHNWEYGWTGKFDALAGKNIIELKSSKIPSTTPWSDHNLQMMAYVEMTQKLGNYNGKVLYISDGQMGIKKPSRVPDNRLIIARNYTSLVLNGRLIPPVLRGENSDACQSCFVAQGCQKLCAGLIQQRDCESCIHNLSCDKKEWNENTQEYFKQFSTALIEEELEGSRINAQFSFISHNNKQLIENMMARGEIIELINKQSESVVSGKYQALFNFKSIHPKFRVGDQVQVFSPNNTNSVVNLFFTCTIIQINNQEVILESLNQLHTPLVMVSSSTTIQQRSSRTAIYQITQSTSTVAEVIQNSLNNEPVKLDEFELTLPILKNPHKDYNSFQLAAILKSLNTPDLFLIQGPAGTGKTSVIVEIVNQFYQQDNLILCSAFTNMAVDNIGKMLKEVGIPFIRIGRKTSIKTEIQSYVAEENVEEYQKLLDKKGPLVVLATTSTIGQQRYRELVFDVALLDEAAQMTEPDALKPILKANRVMLVGDHAQLPPIILSSRAKELNLHISLFERLVKVIPSRFILLQDQYRMNDEILSFPNKMFYQEKLKSANLAIANHHFPKFTGKYLSKDAYQVISINSKNNLSLAYVNDVEVRVLINFIYEMVKADKSLKLEHIGIITPFRSQVVHLRNLLPGMEIDTIDRFQGTEREIILFSTITTRSIPILTDPRRLNVALTRAKKKLVVFLSREDKEMQLENYLLDQLYIDSRQRQRLQHIDVDFDKEFSSSNVEGWIAEIFNHFGIENQYIRIPATVVEQTHFGKNQSTGIYYRSWELIEVGLDEDAEEICLICYKSVQQGVQCLGCSNWFHIDDLLTWLTKKKICPVCRTTLILKI